MDAHPADDCQLIDRYLDDPEADLDLLPSEIVAHLQSCAPCRSCFEGLRLVHLGLRSAPLPEPPPHFASRTMARLGAWERSRPSWQVALYQLGAIVSGVALVGAAAGLLRWGQAPVPYAVWVATASAMLRFLAGLGASLAERPWVALSYPIIAVMLAAMWFLVLAGPRILFGRGSRRAL